MSDEFDREAYSGIAEEFGGLAGWYAKKNGGWSPDAVADALLRLYEVRDLLDGAEDERERGLIALQAFAGNPFEEQLKLAERKFNEKRAA